MATEQTHNAEILWAQRSNEFDDEKVRSRFCIDPEGEGGEEGW